PDPRRRAGPRHRRGVRGPRCAARRGVLRGPGRAVPARGARAAELRADDGLSAAAPPRGAARRWRAAGAGRAAAGLGAVDAPDRRHAALDRRIRDGDLMAGGTGREGTYVPEGIADEFTQG